MGTKDGNHGLFQGVLKIPDNLLNERFNDRYFDVVDGLDEARHIHFNNNNLLAKLEGDSKEISIGETGFGAGRIVVALMEYLNRNNMTGARIEYYTCELYPMEPEKMKDILNIFRDRVPREIDLLLKEYKKTDITSEGFRKLNIIDRFGTMTIHLWIGEALDMVNALEKPLRLWFLDGHGPKKNPSMWRGELIHAIGQKTEYLGECSTFTVSAGVRRELSKAGFTVEKLPGRGRKNEVLHGVKTIK